MNEARLQELIQLLREFLSNQEATPERDELQDKVHSLQQQGEQILEIFRTTPERTLREQARYNQEVDTFLAVLDSLAAKFSSSNQALTSKIKLRLKKADFRDAVSNALSQGKLAEALLVILKTLETFRASAGDEVGIQQRVTEFQSSSVQLLTLDEKIFKPVQKFLNQTIASVSEMTLDDGLEESEMDRLEDAGTQFNDAIVQPFVRARQDYLGNQFMLVASQINSVTEDMQAQLGDLQALINSMQIIGSLLGLFNQIFTLFL